MRKIYLYKKELRSNRKGLLAALLTAFILAALTLYIYDQKNFKLKQEFEKQESFFRQREGFGSAGLLIRTAESSMRGFVLTGEARYESDFLRTNDSLWLAIASFPAFNMDTSIFQDPSIFSQYISLLQQKIDFLEQVYSAAKKDRKEASWLISTGKGPQLTDSIESITRQIITDGNNHLQLSGQNFLQQEKQKNLAIYFLVGITLLMLSVTFYLLVKKIITRKKINELLNEQKEYLNATLTSMSEGLITTDNQGTIVYMNPAAEKITGWKQQEVAGMPVQEVYVVHNQFTGQTIISMVDRILQTRKTIEQENNTVLKTKSKSEIIINNSGSPIFNSKGEITGALLVFNDITEKYQIEKKLKQNEKHLLDIINTLPEAVYTCDADGSIQLYNKAAAKLWGTKPEPGKDKWCGSWKIFRPSDGSSLPVENCPMARAIKTGLPVYGEQIKIQRPDGTYRHVLPYPTPLFDELGRTQGAVNMLIDITEKKERELLIKESEEKFKVVTETSPVAIFVYNQEGFLYANPAALKLSGYEKDDITKIKFINLVHPDDRELVLQRSAARLNGEAVPAHYEIRIIAKSGATFLVEFSGNRIIYEGEPAVVGIANDITERKKHEKDLQDYKYALDQSSIVAITDQKGIIRYTNDNFCKISGYSREELISQDHRIINSGYHSKEFIRDLWVTIAHGKIWRNDICNRAKDGNLYWVDTTIVPFLNEKGKPYQYLVIRNDITGNKKAEEELKQKTFILSEAQRIARIGHWKVEMDTGNLSWNDDLYGIFGVSKETFQPTRENFLALLHPQDREGMIELLENFYIGLGHTDHEFRIVLPDNTERIILGGGKIIYGDEGRMIGLVGTAQDITKQKRKDEEIRMAHQRLTSHLNNSPLGLIEWDKNFYIRKWSVQTEKIFGWKEEEVIHKHFNDFNLVFEEDVPAVWEVALELMEKKADRNASSNRNYTKSGKVIHCRWYNSVLKDENDNVLSIQSIIEDITEYKRAEEEKQMALDRYDILSQATSDTIWDWDMVNNTMLYNEGITNMFGYQSSEIENVADWWNDKLHKEDVEKVAASLHEIFENKQKYFQLTYRFRCADGSYKNIFDRAFVLFDDEGTPYRMIGAMQDVTYQKEEEIRIGRVAIEAQERKRLQIGMELHDNVKQILSATLLYLGMANDKNRSKKEVAEYLEMSHGFILDSIKEIRRLSHQLAPSSFENISLKEVIDLLIQNMNPENHWKVKLQIDEKIFDGINNNIKVNIYRILQEQLSNIVKYADAGKVEVEVEIVDKYILLRIHDNGKGFNPTKVKTGIGLGNIRRRTEVFSGEMFINSSVGKGCELLVKLPLNSGG